LKPERTKKFLEIEETLQGKKILSGWSILFIPGTVDELPYLDKRIHRGNLLHGVRTCLQDDHLNEGKIERKPTRGKLWGNSLVKITNKIILQGEKILHRKETLRYKHGTS
jgi:hypothetical protein